MRRPSDDVLGRVFEALANPTRRAVIESLAMVGEMDFSELMRAAGVRDSSTLKHHLEKLEGLITKNGDGSYCLTPLGREAYRVLCELKDSIARITPAASSPTPLAAVKPVKHHYLVAALIAAAASIASALADVIPAALALAILTAAILATALGRWSRTVIVGRNSLVEITESPFGRRERRVSGRVVGVEVCDGPSSILGLVKLNLVLSTSWGIRTYSVGYVSRKHVETYLRSIETVIKSSARPAG